MVLATNDYTKPVIAIDVQAKPVKKSIFILKMKGYTSFQDPSYRLALADDSKYDTLFPHDINKIDSYAVKDIFKVVDKTYHYYADFFVALHQLAKENPDIESVYEIETNATNFYDVVGWSQ